MPSNLFLNAIRLKKMYNKDVNISSSAMQFVPECFRGEFSIQSKGRSNWPHACLLYFTQITRVVSNQTNGTRL